MILSPPHNPPPFAFSDPPGSLVPQPNPKLNLFPPSGYLRSLLDNHAFLVEHVVSEEVNHVEVGLGFVHELLTEDLSNQTGEILFEECLVLQTDKKRGHTFERQQGGCVGFRMALYIVDLLWQYAFDETAFSL